MNFIPALSFALLLLLVASAAAQEAKPCVSPPLMSGGLTVMGGNGAMLATGTISYDNFAKRVRVRAMRMNGNETSTFDQLLLFSQKVYYEIDWSKLSCKKKPLDATFVPMQVPVNARLMGQAVLGSSSSWGMGVLCNTWFGELPDGVYSLVFTEVGCIPMVYNGYSVSSGWTMVSTFNWVIGNTNPMDYFPPSICAQSELDETEAPANFFSIVQSLAKKTKSVEFIPTN